LRAPDGAHGVREPFDLSDAAECDDSAFLASLTRGSSSPAAAARTVTQSCRSDRASAVFKFRDQRLSPRSMRVEAVRRCLSPMAASQMRSDSCSDVSASSIHFERQLR
jgi:hypothetical protein